MCKSSKHLSQPRLLVIGDLILDGYTWGRVERVSPEAPVIVLSADSHDVRLGGAASVAMLAQVLEARVSVAGVVGNDANGKMLRQLLTDAQIEQDLVFDDSSRPTTANQRFIGRSESKYPYQVIRVDGESDLLLSDGLRNRLVDAILARLSDFDAVLISDYAKGVCRGRRPLNLPPDPSNETETHAASPLLQSVIAAANERQMPVLVDPGRRADYNCYRGATLLKPNRSEAQLAVGFEIRSIDAATQAAERLCESLGLQAAAVTLDRDGIVLARRNHATEHYSIAPRKVVDITGAGDTALAMMGLVLGDACAKRLNGDDMNDAVSDAIKLANIASGLQVERWGVCPITRDEIDAELNQSTVVESRKLTTTTALQTLCSQYRQQGKTIVFTNGCFDLLHVGHLACLKQASRLGDVLIVAINSDVSVRLLKGPGRPVINQTDRAAMLSGLECVDHVLIFDKPTPHDLLRQLQPDILVKGKTTAEVTGREIVEAYGGKVVITDGIDGISTTELIRKTNVSRSAKDTQLRRSA